MPQGPRGEKPPADSIGATAKVTPSATDIVGGLCQIFDEVPADLEAYFTRIGGSSYAERWESGVNLLTIGKAVDLTKDFRKFHPVIQALDGFILDDAETSDHHVYLSSPSLRGAVLYLAHDGDTRIVFESLAAFLASADAAIASDKDLTGFHPLISPIAPDQERLSELITLQLGSAGGTTVITAVIPSMDLRDKALLRRLVQSRDFFLGEAVAVEIARRPSADLRDVAELCAAHPHVQASKAGLRALTALAAMGW